MPRFTLKQLLVSMALFAVSLALWNLAGFFYHRVHFFLTVFFGLFGFATAGIGAGLLWEEPKRSVLLALVFAVVLALSPLLFSP